jgi:hypothetical protein
LQARISGDSWADNDTGNTIKQLVKIWRIFMSNPK